MPETPQKNKNLLAFGYGVAIGVLFIGTSRADAVATSILFAVSTVIITTVAHIFE